MLTQVNLVGDETINMNVLGAGPRDSLQVRKITGLGPPDVDLFLGEYAGDGGSYNGRRVVKRNVVMELGLNPNHGENETVDGLRQTLYKMFLDPSVNGDNLFVELVDDIQPKKLFEGYVEKFEGEIFSKDTAVQISLMCPDPYLVDATETELTGSFTTFPFTYGGSAETGFYIEVEVTAPTDVLTIDNNGSRMVFEFDFLLDDVLKVNTTPGSRSVLLDRAGFPNLEILYTMTGDSPWIKLHSQNNVLKVYDDIPGMATVAAMTKLRYRQRYWGI